MIGRWDYSQGAPAYGTEVSYRVPAAFLDGCGSVIEDWGCGGAAARRFFTQSRYVGIDGSGPYADVVHDLREPRATDASGILLRHVLEHNFSWPDILWNAAESGAGRIAIVCFLEPRPFTELWRMNPDGIPNLHVGELTLLRILSDFVVRREVVARPEVDRKGEADLDREWIFLAGRKERLS